MHLVRDAQRNMATVLLRARMLARSSRTSARVRPAVRVMRVSGAVVALSGTAGGSHKAADISPDAAPPAAAAHAGADRDACLCFPEPQEFAERYRAALGADARLAKATIHSVVPWLTGKSRGADVPAIIARWAVEEQPTEPARADARSQSPACAAYEAAWRQVAAAIQACGTPCPCRPDADAEWVDDQ